MVPWRATEEGFVTPEVLDWYGRFADGKPGVLVVEATGIREVASGPLLRIGHDRYLPGLRELVRVVRERSEGQTRLLIQIIDFLSIRRRPEREKFLRRFLRITPEHRSGLGLDPSAAEDQVREALCALPQERLLELLSPREAEDLEMGARERVSDLHLPHIQSLPQELPELFAQAAARAKSAGFDGVELHYAHAYTMASFLSATNTRDDGYGGDLEGRLRLPLEVYAQVRERVGPDYGVGCRFLVDEVIEGGSSLEDILQFSQRFAAAGMDFLSLSRGGKFDDAKQPKLGQAAYPYTGPSGHECMPHIKIEGGPFGRYLPLVGRVAQALRAAGHATPIVGCGGINDFELAEAALQAGDCQMVAAARQTLADPDWFLKMEMGRGQEIRRCLYTNYCEALDQKHVEVTCQLWDRDFTQPDVGAPEGAPIQRTRDQKRRLSPPAS